MSSMKPIVVLLALSTTAFATETLRPDLQDLAGDISKGLAGHGQTEVSLGDFTCEGNAAATSGTGILFELTQELEKKYKIRVNPKATFRVQGTYKLALDTEAGHLSAVFEVRLLEADRGRGSFKKLVKFSRPTTTGDIDSAGVLGVLGSGTVELDPNTGRVDRHKEIDGVFTKPKAHVNGTIVRTTAKSPVGIEILVDGKPLTPTLEEGRPHIPLKRDAIYTIRLTNDSELDMAVGLHIDGLSLFTFSEIPGLRYYLIPRKSTGVIVGWYRNEKVADAFQVTEYAKSEAAKLLKDHSQRGTITATFSAAWEKNKPSPTDEAAAKLIFDRGGDVGTSRGPTVEQKSRVIERHIGVVRSIISVHYSKK